MEVDVGQEYALYSITSDLYNPTFHQFFISSKKDLKSQHTSILSLFC